MLVGQPGRKLQSTVYILLTKQTLNSFAISENLVSKKSVGMTEMLLVGHFTHKELTDDSKNIGHLADLILLVSSDHKKFPAIFLFTF